DEGVPGYVEPEHRHRPDAALVADQPAQEAGHSPGDPPHPAPEPPWSRPGPPAPGSAGCRSRTRSPRRWPRPRTLRRPAAATAIPGRRTSRRRELGEVVDAQVLLDLGDLIDGLLEAVLPEQPVLLLLELLAEFLQPLGRDDLVQGREQYRVLTGFVRAVHADERLA